MGNRGTLSTLLVGLVFIACQWPSPRETQELARFPVDSLEGVLTPDAVHLDKEITSDGGGAIRVETHEPTVVHLYELAGIDVENTRLTYAAHLRSEDLEGQAYLEMWCHFDDQGEYFSRGLADPLTGTEEWTSREISFFLKAGENPDRVTLNLAVEGRGTVWIDDISLTKEPY